jgi:SPP1 family phage portal protein
VQIDSGEIQKDESVKINPRPHVLYRKEDDEGSLYCDAFGFIPFFRLDANRKKNGHLQPIKGIIDDYDLMACGLSNNLQDVTEALYVVKGFQGDNLEELIQNVRTKKVIGTEPDGGIDIKTVDLPYTARIQKLELDEKNIYRFGMGFNSAQIGDGNVTNVVIRSRYALLDLKCNKLETRVKAFLKNLCKIALQEINELNGTDFKPSDVYFDFQREIMTNATDNATMEKTEAETQQVRLNTILNAAARLDNETVLRAICDLFELDYDEVSERVEKNPAGDLNAASEALANALIDDAGGGEGNE